jgi:hypothetical protein
MLELSRCGKGHQMIGRLIAYSTLGGIVGAALCAVIVDARKYPRKAKTKSSAQ